MITFVTWKWAKPGYARTFEAHYVNVLYAMIARHYHAPFELVCIADDMTGISTRIRVLPLPLTPLDDVVSPHGERFPSCYRRLWNFSTTAAERLGPVIIALDVDVIITGDITPLFYRTETFVGWTDERATWNRKIAGGLYMLRTGFHHDVWNKFDPVKSPQDVTRAGLSGSDQGWMSLVLYPPPGRFTVNDGVYSSKWLEPGKPLPSNCRIVSTPGDLKPWHPQFQKRYPWTLHHWKA